ncbi:MAG TPA: DsbA family protein [Egibacteraceae bacterium]|nr:DsbA family protein [Egibacteraceae bacterium]
MLTLFHDYTSPASAVAAFRVQRLADEGLAVRFEGFEAVGVDATLTVTAGVLAAVDELAAAARAEKLSLLPPAALPPTALAHLLGELAAQRGLGASWRQTCYRAYWERGLDIGNRHVLVGLAGLAGMDEGETRALLADAGRLSALRRRMAGFRRDGVGGVPMILAQGTLVPGLLPEDDLRLLAEL